MGEGMVYKAKEPQSTDSAGGPCFDCRDRLYDKLRDRACRENYFQVR